MTQPSDVTAAPPVDAVPARRPPLLDRIGLEVIAIGLVALVVMRVLVSDALQIEGLQTWSTFFVSITIQALPFLVMGVVVSGVLAAFLPSESLSRLLPKKGALAVPVAGCAGVLLPGCECGAVPISGRLVARGIAPAAALTFMLAAPAINPVVLVSTAVAFPGAGEVVLARFLASLVTAVVVGWIWLRVGNTEAIIERVRRHVHEGDSRLGTFVATVRHDFLHAGGYLVIGAAAAATLQVVVPRSVLESVAGSGITAVLTMATLAVVLSICSEADAFVAASLTQFSLTSRLVFMVVGPVVDLKLIALQSGIYGRSFATRFAPTALVVSMVSALAFGWWLL